MLQLVHFSRVALVLLSLLYRELNISMHGLLVVLFLLTLRNFNHSMHQ